MLSIKEWTLCKALAIVLCVILVFEANYVFSRQETPESKFESAKHDYVNGEYKNAISTLKEILEYVDESKPENKDFLACVYLLLGACQEKLGETEAAKKSYAKAKQLLGEKEPSCGEDISFFGLALYVEIFAPQKEEDVLVAEFIKGRDAYFAGDFEAAKRVLETLITTLGSIAGRDTLKGETYLLMGATYEKLKYKELAIKYYCRAKEILGEGRTIEGLELKKLKYYKENCAGPAMMAVAGARRKSVIGKILGFLLSAAIVGGAVWYLYFSKNAPLRKKGKYTSITARLDIKFKGFGSTGTYKVSVDNVNKVNEDFTFTQTCTATSTQCSEATVVKSYTFPVTITSTSMVIKEEVINWDYYYFPGCKMLCLEWTLTVEKYEYAEGKDPGSPQASGLEGLNAFTNCQPVSSRVESCTNEATITFSAPANSAKAQRVFSVSQTKKGCL